MKIRVRNSKQSEIKVVLEPWASEYMVAPGDYIEFVAESQIPRDGYFEIEESSYGITVTPE